MLTSIAGSPGTSTFDAPVLGWKTFCTKSSHVAETSSPILPAARLRAIQLETAKPDQVSGIVSNAAL